MSETNTRTGDYGLEEGECGRCGKLVTRKPGGKWTDQFGRDRCRADPDDGQCQVTATWPYQAVCDETEPKPPKRPILAAGSGAATHNKASEPGKLKVIVWGKRKHGKRDVGVVLDEQAATVLLAHLGRYGFGIKDGPQ